MEFKDVEETAHLVLRVLQEMECSAVTSRNGFRIAGHASKNSWNRKARRDGARSGPSNAEGEERPSLPSAQVLDPFLPPDAPAQALFGLEVYVSKRDSKVHVSVLWTPPAKVKDSEAENQSRVHFQQFFEVFLQEGRVTTDMTRQIKRKTEV